jgi:hypothetical protein
MRRSERQTAVAFFLALAQTLAISKSHSKNTDNIDGIGHKNRYSDPGKSADQHQATRANMVWWLANRAE